MNCARLPLILLCLTIVASAAIAWSGTPPATAQDDDAATPAPLSPDCTVWRDDPDDGREPAVCTMSPPWWTAWATCPITPVQSERWSPRSAADQGLGRVPWIVAEPASAGLVGHLYYGNRPLHVAGRFPDGAAAKVLWEFTEPVHGLAIVATELWSGSASLTLQSAGVDQIVATQWPTYLDLPTAGCWQVTLSATTEAGDSISGKATFVVIAD